VFSCVCRAVNDLLCAAAERGRGQLGCSLGTGYLREAGALLFSCLISQREGRRNKPRLLSEPSQAEGGCLLCAVASRLEGLLPLSRSLTCVRPSRRMGRGRRAGRGRKAGRGRRAGGSHTGAPRSRAAASPPRMQGCSKKAEGLLRVLVAAPAAPAPRRAKQQQPRGAGSCRAARRAPEELEGFEQPSALGCGRAAASSRCRAPGGPECRACIDSITLCIVMLCTGVAATNTAERRAERNDREVNMAE